MATLYQAICLWSILHIHSIYSVSYIIDSWGSISLPFRTEQCQHIFPVEHFAIYECEEKSSTSTVIAKDVFAKSLCDDDEFDYELDSPYNETVYFNTTAGNCDKNTAESETTEMDESMVTIQAFCDLEAPGARDLYLATGVCFQLSQQNNNTIYAKLKCDSNYFYTKYYVGTSTEAMECKGDATFKRDFDLLSCDTWLYANETGFGFDIKAAMMACDDSGVSALFNGIHVGVLLLMIMWSVLY